MAPVHGGGPHSSTTVPSLSESKDPQGLYSFRSLKGRALRSGLFLSEDIALLCSFHVYTAVFQVLHEINALTS